MLYKLQMFILPLLTSDFSSVKVKQVLIQRLQRPANPDSSNN